MNGMLAFAGALFLIAGAEPESKSQNSKSRVQVVPVEPSKAVTGGEIESMKQAAGVIRKGVEAFDSLIDAQGKRVDAYQRALEKAKCDARVWAKELSAQRDSYKANPPQCPDARRAYEAKFCANVAECSDRHDALEKWSKAVAYAKKSLGNSKARVVSMRKKSEVVELGIGELDALFISARIVEAAVEATKIQADLEKLQKGMGAAANSLLAELRNLETELSKRTKSEASKQFKQASGQLEKLLEASAN